jgi:hypothetical protein
LVGGRPLEASRRFRAAFALGRARVDEALLVQHASHRALGDAQALVSGQLVADPPGAGLGLRALGLNDRVAPGVALECPLARWLAGRNRDQPVHAVRPEAQHPFLDRGVRQPEGLRDLAVAASLFEDEFHRSQP